MGLIYRLSRSLHFWMVHLVRGKLRNIVMHVHFFQSPPIWVIQSQTTVFEGSKYPFTKLVLGKEVCQELGGDQKSCQKWWVKEIPPTSTASLGCWQWACLDFCDHLFCQRFVHPRHGFHCPRASHSCLWPLEEPKATMVAWSLSHEGQCRHTSCHLSLGWKMIDFAVASLAIFWLLHSIACKKISTIFQKVQHTDIHFEKKTQHPPFQKVFFLSPSWFLIPRVFGPEFPTPQSPPTFARVSRDWYTTMDPEAAWLACDMGEAIWSQGWCLFFRS